MKRKYSILGLSVAILILIFMIFSIKLSTNSRYFMATIFALMGLISITVTLMTLLIKRLLANNGKLSIKNNYIYFPIIFFLFSLTLLLISINITTYNLKIISYKKSTMATTVEIKREHSYVSNNYSGYDIIDYNSIKLNYQVDNIDYNNYIVMLFQDIDLGSKIKIYYDPNNPNYITNAVQIIEEVIMLIFSSLLVGLSIVSIKKKKLIKSK